MNGGRFFVDSNVFLYEMSSADGRKQFIASQWLLALWGHSSGRLSWQVIHELYSNAVCKLGMSASTVRSTVEDLMEWNPARPSASLLQRAWHWCDVAQLNYWDALIVAAAEQSGCDWLLSEDFQAGREFGSVTVVNPFLREPNEFGLA